MSGFSWSTVHNWNPETFRNKGKGYQKILWVIPPGVVYEVISFEAVPNPDALYQLCLSEEEYIESIESKSVAKGTRKLYRETWETKYYHVNKGEKLKMLPYQYSKREQTPVWGVCNEVYSGTNACYAWNYGHYNWSYRKKIPFYVYPYPSAIPSSVLSFSVEHDNKLLGEVLARIVRQNGILVETVEAFSELGRSIGLLARIWSTLLKLTRIRNTKFEWRKLWSNRRDRWVEEWHWLDYEFGAKPLADFAVDFALAMNGALEFYRRLNLGLTHRIVEESGGTEFGDVESYGRRVEYNVEKKTKYTAYVTFKIHDETKFSSFINQVAPMTFNSLWQAMTLSWFIDAIADVDSFLHAMELYPVHGLDLKIDMLYKPPYS
jgi:hypothetical protein